MHIDIGHGTLELVTGDITEQTVDAIVNAANSSLAGGGGVDGAIHRGGGPSIMAETRERYPQGCPTGDAVITGAGNLPARYVIHAVGPIWRGGQQGEPQQLANAYRRSLQIAVHHGCQSVALPALSTGAYGYPIELAAQTALQTVCDFLREREVALQVRFVLFDAATQDVFVAALEALKRK